METVYDEPSGSSTTSGLEEFHLMHRQYKNVPQNSSVRKLSIEERALHIITQA